MPEGQCQRPVASCPCGSYDKVYNIDDTIFEQDKHMMTFIEAIEKGETDFLLSVDAPTCLCNAKFVRMKDDNFELKFSIPEGGDFHAEYFFSRPAVLSIQGKILIVLMNTDVIRFTQSLNNKGPQEVKVVYKSFVTEENPTNWKNSKHCARCQRDRSVASAKIEVIKG